MAESYNTLARLTATRLRRQDSVELNKHEYLYNNRHERTKHTRSDNSYVNFGYDNLGQLNSALGYTTATPAAAARSAPSRSVTLTTAAGT